MPALEAIDDLRNALDCAIEKKDKRAAKILLEAIGVVLRAVDEIDAEPVNGWTGNQHHQPSLTAKGHRSDPKAKPSTPGKA